MVIFLWSLGVVFWVSLAILMSCEPVINGLSYYELKMADDLLSLVLLVTIGLKYHCFWYAKIKWIIGICYRSIPFLVIVFYSILMSKTAKEHSLKPSEKNMVNSKK